MKWQAIAVASVLALATQASAADKNYGPGTSDTEIKLGQTSPFSGPAFMALELVPGALDGVEGEVRYPPPFGAF